MRWFEKGAAKGFTLLETMVALAVLAVAVVGALAAINHSNVELQQGQLRLYKGVLADEAIQRWRLAPKWTIPAVAFTTAPDAMAIGANPWQRDPNGAYFVVLTDEAKPTTLADPNTACDQVPVGIVCREVLWTTGLPVPGAADGGIVPAGVQPITRWVRVSRGGELPSSAVVQREVFLQ